MPILRPVQDPVHDVGVLANAPALAGLPRFAGKLLRDLDELAEPNVDVEVDGKGLPILLKQYAKVGGKLLGFNVDHKFADVLDGLVVVDLRETEPAVLKRYMGREALAASGATMGCARRWEFSISLR